MTKRKLIKRRNKTLIDIPYYDDFIHSPERKNRYFKRYLKTYKLIKRVTKKLYINHLGRQDKNVIFFIDAGVFYLLNTIYTVLNFESIKNILRENYPSIDRVLYRNYIEINKKKPSLLVAMNFTLSLTIINSQNKERHFVTGSKHEIFTNLDDFCLFYETFIRKYYLDKEYDIRFNEIQIGLFYRYGGNKTKKDNQKKVK